MFDSSMILLPAIVNTRKGSILTNINETYQLQTGLDHFCIRPSRAIFSDRLLSLLRVTTPVCAIHAPISLTSSSTQLRFRFFDLFLFLVLSFVEFIIRLTFENRYLQDIHQTSNILLNFNTFLNCWSSKQASSSNCLHFFVLLSPTKDETPNN